MTALEIRAAAAPPSRMPSALTAAERPHTADSKETHPMPQIRHANRLSGPLSRRHLAYSGGAVAALAALWLLGPLLAVVALLGAIVLAAVALAVVTSPIGLVLLAAGALAGAAALVLARAAARRAAPEAGR